MSNLVNKAIYALTNYNHYHKSHKQSNYRNETLYISAGFKFYDKHRELNLKANRDICEVLGLANIEQFRNTLRCEKRYGSFKKIRDSFRVGCQAYKEPKLVDVLKSKEPVNFKSYNKIKLKELSFFEEKGNMTLLQYERLVGVKTIIEKCNYDIENIEHFLKTNGSKNWRSTKLPEYKAIRLSMLKENKNPEVYKEIIKYIENELQLCTTTSLDSIKIKVVNEEGIIRENAELFKETITKDGKEIQSINHYLKDEYKTLGLKRIYIHRGKYNEPEYEIEMSAKALREKYQEGITLNNIEYALENIQKGGIELNTKKIIDNAITCYVDCTNNIKLIA